MENIAEAVTHAKFVGSTDTASDEVVLLKILQVRKRESERGFGVSAT